MNIRTDLALERVEVLSGQIPPGVTRQQHIAADIPLS